MRSNFLSNKSFRALEGVKKLIGTLWMKFENTFHTTNKFSRHDIFKVKSKQSTLIMFGLFVIDPIKFHSLLLTIALMKNFPLTLSFSFSFCVSQSLFDIFIYIYLKISKTINVIHQIKTKWMKRDITSNVLSLRDSVRASRVGDTIICTIVIILFETLFGHIFRSNESIVTNQQSIHNLSFSDHHFSVID
jgi:hypothetical protein